MKKSIISIVALAGLVALCTACGATRKGTASVPTAEDTTVEMKVFPERNGGAPDKVDLTITNNSDEVIQFGAGYSVERLVDGKWVDHELGNFPVIMILYSLAPGESETYTVNLFSDRVKYPEGDYRIVRQIAVGEGQSRPFYGYFKVIEPR